MPRATNNNGTLAYLDYSGAGGGKSVIYTPCGNICLKILPEVSDSKGATYVSENSGGRSSPLVSYAHSEPRAITTNLHFMTTTVSDINENMKNLRILQNLVYPGDSTANVPFTPPPVVRFVHGSLMDGTQGLCLILKNYSVSYPTEFAVDVVTFLPYRFSVNCTWEVVYACKNLPVNRCTVPGANVYYPGDNIESANNYYVKGL